MKTRAGLGRHPSAALDCDDTEKRPPTTRQRQRGPDQQEVQTPMAAGNPTYRSSVSIPAAEPRNDRG
jgi:hypothetical protein